MQLQKCWILNFLSWKRALPASTAQMLKVTTEQEALGSRDRAEILKGSVPITDQELETRSSTTG